MSIAVTEWPRCNRVPITSRMDLTALRADGRTALGRKENYGKNHDLRCANVFLWWSVPSNGFLRRNYCTTFRNKRLFLKFSSDKYHIFVPFLMLFPGLSFWKSCTCPPIQFIQNYLDASKISLLSLYFVLFLAFGLGNYFDTSLCNCIFISLF